jgi:isoquinoline 1-oxidoreductase subunit alpha
MSYSLNINGQTYVVDAPSADTPLLWVLRDILHLTGTKYGCGISVCWACTVLINGQADKSCDVTVGSAVGKTITTIEGLANFRLASDAPGTKGMGQKLQEAWVAAQVPQCGYCQSGMLMQAAGLFVNQRHPANGDINGAMQNVCVCGTYQRVKAAINSASTAV